MQDAEPQATFDADDQKIVEVARLTEPVLGERHKVGVAVDRHGDAEPPRQLRAKGHIAVAGGGQKVAVAVDGRGAAEPPRQLRAKGHIAVAEDRALPAYARGTLDDTR